jgi:hypothetical protein
MSNAYFGLSSCNQSNSTNQQRGKNIYSFEKIFKFTVDGNGLLAN